MLDLSKYKLSKSDKLVVAVSGGGDSMALLDMLRDSGYNLVVCHVNYKKRDTADRDEEIVRKYAENFNLAFVEKDATNPSGNFQKWAREFRYHFFKEIYDKYSASALLVAHQQDDLIETYLFKKKRSSLGTSLALRDEENIFGMRIVRPLLNYSKNDLKEYCVSRCIKYGVDETNFLDSYTRNRIRHHEVEVLDKEKRLELIDKINREENEWIKMQTHLETLIHNDSIDLAEFSNLQQIEKRSCLYLLIVKNVPGVSRKLSHSRLDEFIKEIGSNKPNINLFLMNDCYLIKEYSRLYIKHVVDKEYAYRYDRLIEDKRECFELTAHECKKMQGICVYDSDYPITIRTPLDSDYIDLKEGRKSLKRLFIDKKVPMNERKNYPILVNSAGKVLLVTDLYRFYERKTLQNNLFVIKCINY